MESLGKTEEKQESAIIVELKNRIKSLMNDEHLQQKVNANVGLAKVKLSFAQAVTFVLLLRRDCRSDLRMPRINPASNFLQDLEAKVKQLVDENPGEFFSAKVKAEDGEASVAAASAAAAEIESLKQHVASLKEKIRVKSDKCETLKSEAESRVLNQCVMMTCVGF